MSDYENDKNQIENTNGYRTFAKNMFYSYLNNYGLYFFSLFTSFLMARLITKELWGFYIIAISYILIISIILEFFPPALVFTLNHYIPSYLVSNQKAKLKSLIKNALLLKIIILIPAVFVSIAVFIVFTPLFSINLENYTTLLIILAPLILINGLDAILNSIYRGFSKFKIIFYLLTFQYAIKISTLGFFVIFSNSIDIEVLAFITLFAGLIPFILNGFIFLNLYLKIKPETKEKSSFKIDLSKSIKFGAPLSIGLVLNEFWKQIQIQTIGICENSSIVTGFSIARNYSSISLNSSSSLTFPIITTFSSLNKQNDQNQITQIYNTVYKYSLFLLLILSGISILVTEFFLSVIYGESFLIFTFIVKLYFFVVVFKSLESIFGSLIVSINKVKFYPVIVFFGIVIKSSFFFIGLIYFGIIGAIIGLIISNFIEFLFQLFFSFKIGKIKMKLTKIFLQYSIFFVSLVITTVLNLVVLSELNYIILNFLNLEILVKLNLLSISVFLLIFFVLSFTLKIFSTQDFELILLYFNKDKKSHKLIRRILKIVSKKEKEIK